MIGDMDAPSTLLTLVAVALGGGVGAVLRHELSRVVDQSTRVTGPVGIFTVNVVASAAIGVLLGVGMIGVAHNPDLARLGIVLASGLLGGFSTLSTVATDSAKLLENRRWGWAVMNTVGMLIISTLACWGGVTLGHTATGAF